MQLCNLYNAIGWGQTSNWYKQFHHLLPYIGLSCELVLPGVFIAELLKFTFNEDLIGVNLLKSW